MFVCAELEGPAYNFARAVRLPQIKNEAGVVRGFSYCRRDTFDALFSGYPPDEGTNPGTYRFTYKGAKVSKHDTPAEVIGAFCGRGHSKCIRYVLRI